MWAKFSLLCVVAFVLSANSQVVKLESPENGVMEKFSATCLNQDNRTWKIRIPMDFGEYLAKYTKNGRLVENDWRIYGNDSLHLELGLDLNNDRVPDEVLDFILYISPNGKYLEFQKSFKEYKKNVLILMTAKVDYRKRKDGGDVSIWVYNPDLALPEIRDSEVGRWNEKYVYNDLAKGIAYWMVQIP